jgi:lipopolysaccharide/colanic/teichoic acid biosynthesis glycosyltransferase
MERNVTDVKTNSIRLKYEEIIRRQIDIGAALLLIIFLSPLALVVAAFIMLDGGPPFFVHRRLGRNGVPFNCLKFRTMVVGAEQCLAEYLRYHPEAEEEWNRDQKLQLDPRITPIGRLLRKTSLDEIPQMWNVLVGDMSLVGPRPVTESEMRDRYGRYASVVLSVRPGVTGLWQVSGRNEINYVDRVLLDTQYVRSRRLMGDLDILFKTTRVVFARVGAR